MAPEDFRQLEDIGLRKLLALWEENTQEQQEYYICFAAEGSDPFTVTLSEDEEDKYVTQ
jgi:hypothetical protein